MVLMKMYQKYAELKKWKFEIMSFSETNIGGCKEAIISFTGTDVFSQLKYESGVHRVQRVPSNRDSRKNSYICSYCSSITYD